MRGRVTGAGVLVAVALSLGDNPAEYSDHRALVARIHDRPRNGQPQTTKPPREQGFREMEERGIRTADLLGAIQALSQLS